MATRSLRSRQRSASDIPLPSEISEEETPLSPESRNRPLLTVRSPISPISDVEEEIRASETKPSRRRVRSRPSPSSSFQAVSHSAEPWENREAAEPLETHEERPPPSFRSLAPDDPRRLAGLSEEDGVTLKDLRREILEARNLVIKADNQVKSLSGELKVITKFLEGERRRRAFSSASAYVLFALLSFGGLYLFFHSKLADLETQTRELEAERQALSLEAKDRLSRDDQTRAAEEAALGIIRTIRAGDLEKALKDYQELNFAHLTPLEAEILRMEVEKQRNILAREHFDRGEELYRAKQYKRAEEEFSAALAVHKDSARVPEALYYLGMIHYHLGKFPDAIEELERAREEAPKATWGDEALYHIASSYEEMKQLARAKEEYQTYLQKYPRGHYASLAKSKLSYLQQQ